MSIRTIITEWMSYIENLLCLNLKEKKITYIYYFLSIRTDLQGNWKGGIDKDNDRQSFHLSIVSS